MHYQDEHFAQIEQNIHRSEELYKRLEQGTPEDSLIPSKEDSSGESLEGLPTQEEIDSGVEKNALHLEGMELTFKQTSFFDGRISLKFPHDFFTLSSDDYGYLVYMNLKNAVNCILNYTAGGGEIDLQAIKKGIMDIFKQSQVRTSCIEEGMKRVNGNPMGYCVVINHTPNFDIFNYMIYTAVRDGHVIVNFNGDKKVFGLWEMLAKSLMNTIEV